MVQSPVLRTLVAGCVLATLALLAAPAPAQTPAGENVDAATVVRTPEDNVVVLHTTQGLIVIELHPAAAPHHVENFLKLVRQGFYNGTRFHRVIPDYLIQAGDPNSRDDNRELWGRGGPGYTLDAEFNDRPHKRGSVSMARGYDPNSAGSQFFICLRRDPNLDGHYSNFGTVIIGMETVHAIARQRLDPEYDYMPLKPATITRAEVLPRLQALKLKIKQQP